MQAKIYNLINKINYLVYTKLDYVILYRESRATICKYILSSKKSPVSHLELVSRILRNTPFSVKNRLYSIYPPRKLNLFHLGLPSVCLKSNSNNFNLIKTLTLFRILALMTST